MHHKAACHTPDLKDGLHVPWVLAAQFIGHKSGSHSFSPKTPGLGVSSADE